MVGAINSKIRRIDLNLLNVFQVLDKTRNVTAGAKELGLSQPALSHALARLREALGDQLFVKASKSMVPTPRALKIAPLVQEVLTQIEEGILDQGQFSPASLQRIFRIKASDFIEAMLLPTLMGQLHLEAPGIQISTTTPEFELPRQKLEQGICDVAIGGFFGALPDGFYQQKLFEDVFASAVRIGHPRIKSRTKVGLVEFCKERHALIAPGGELKGSVDKLLKGKKKQRVIAAGLGSFVASGYIVEHSDLMLTAPSRLLHLMAEKFSLRVFPTPLAVEKISIVQAWHERNHEDPAHKWLRSKIREVLQVVPKPYAGV